MRAYHVVSCLGPVATRPAVWSCGMTICLSLLIACCSHSGNCTIPTWDWLLSEPAACYLLPHGLLPPLRDLQHFCCLLPLETHSIFNFSFTLTPLDSTSSEQKVSKTLLQQQAVSISERVVCLRHCSIAMQGNS